MPYTKFAPKDKNERLLILAVDIDNDLFRKTKISGPVMGRVQNLSAATQLILADPEDTDGNTMFQAVKLYDELRKEDYSVNIATVTGTETEGYDADREISRQLDLVLASYKTDACVFVTDGASDERILPLIESRIKINSVKIVTIKQAKQFENTYFVILEKLKEPHYARIVFGIPAILLLLFAISYALGLGWQLPVGLIGIYLVMKGFGLEESFLESFRGFGFSVDRMSFVFYFSSIIFFIASIMIAYGNYANQVQLGANPLMTWSFTIEGFLLLLPVMLILYLIGRMLDTRGSRYIFRGFKYGTYIGSSVILWVLLYALVAWVIGQIYFSQLLGFALVAIVLGVGISALTNFLRRRTLRGKNMKNKIVVNELGAMLGKVAGVDVKRGMLMINTSFGNAIRYSVDRIVDVSDKVVIK
jgi:putative membrane protein